MKRYIFILGQNPELSQQEIINIIKRKKGIIEAISNSYVLAKINIKPAELINNLGGIIKIVEYKESINNLENLNIIDYYQDNLNKEKKNNIGFSIYNSNNKEYHKIFKSFLELKKELKKDNYKIRLVSSKENILSSVIVSKNKLLNKELIIIKDHNNYLIGLTLAIQDFAKYSKRDMLRPARDNKSGMLPPKLAQIMINLANLDTTKVFLDPFCGSGTILQEAMLLGYQNINGSDLSNKAVMDTKENIAWLKKEYNLKNNINIQRMATKDLSKFYPSHSIDLIITEPFMGDARLIQKTNDKEILKSIKYELQELYLNTFKEFKKILSPQGRIVFIFPIIDNLYTLDQRVLNNIDFKLIKVANNSANLSNNNNLIYSRDKQKVKREITIWQN